MRFAQQIVWLTGASSGIGEALAHAFANEGATLILSSRRAEELERVRRACARHDEHLCLPFDLACGETFPARAAEVLARFGRIDVLVNNGGIGQRARAIEASPQSERTIMEIDYFGAVALTKAVLPSMLARRSGRIVVVSSVMGYVGTPGRSSYAAAKHALHGYFDSLRAEIWHDGVTVTIACPGYVRTAISRHALGPQAEPHDRLDATTARGISPEHCAAAILRGIARDREEIAVGGKEVAAIYLKRFAPWLFSRIARQMKFSLPQATDRSVARHARH
jgi:short-subunit dehydrogenase